MGGRCDTALRGILVLIYVVVEELYKYLCFRSNPIICIVSMIICIVKE